MPRHARRAAARAALGLCSLLAVGSARPTIGLAQVSFPLPAVESRVRVHRIDAPRVVGTVVPWGADTVAVRTDDSRTVMPIPVASITGYEMLTGRDRWRGARRGAAVGAGVGVLLIGLAIREDLDCGDCYIPASVVAVPAALVLTVLGSGVGTVIAPARWTTVGARRESRLPTGARVGLRLAF
jgi:hypothetical protein